MINEFFVDMIHELFYIWTMVYLV